MSEPVKQPGAYPTALGPTCRRRTTTPTAYLCRRQRWSSALALGRWPCARWTAGRTTRLLPRLTAWRPRCRRSLWRFRRRLLPRPRLRRPRWSRRSRRLQSLPRPLRRWRHPPRLPRRRQRRRITTLRVLAPLSIRPDLRSLPPHQGLRSPHRYRRRLSVRRRPDPRPTSHRSRWRGHLATPLPLRAV